MHTTKATPNVTRVALAAAALFLGACHHEKTPTTTPGDGAATGDDAAKPATDGGGDATASAKIKCFGINSCSGQSACDVPDGRVAAGSKGHACAGQNECSGKGWILLTQAECDEKKGQPL